MGRPLFSRVHQTPVVHVEPEHPTYEKWSYWNPFDPDSDEFFENENAVYEAPVDPSEARFERDVEIGRRIVVVENSSSSEASSSEASSSGRASPASDTDAGPFSIENVTLVRRRAEWPQSPQAEGEPEDGYRILAEGNRRRNAPLAYRETAQRMRESSPRRVVIQGSVDTTPSSRPFSPQREAGPDLPAPTESFERGDGDLPREDSLSSPIDAGPVFLPPLSPIILAPSRPSTPPNQTSPLYGSPSPPPSVTPRLYTWAPPPHASYPTSPAPSRPFLNRTARLSMDHIPPSPTRSLVPVDRMVGRARRTAA